ncbi:MAG: hypothetical protein GYA24_23560 [Candidatus Lokiarchaeota archaeon]|nr:hypothetical protein [Candidatus Lokiarchaeota archaeon]
MDQEHGNVVLSNLLKDLGIQVRSMFKPGVLYLSGRPRPNPPVSIPFEFFKVASENFGEIERLETIFVNYPLDFLGYKNRPLFPNLTQLSLTCSDLKSIEYVGINRNLVKLYLNHNKISRIQYLNDFPNLENLILSSNQISKIEGLSRLGNLRTLDLSSNKISVIENLESLQKIEELRLAFNKIRDLGDTEGLKALNPNVKVDMTGTTLTSPFDTILVFKKKLVDLFPILSTLKKIKRFPGAFKVKQKQADDSATLEPDRIFSSSQPIKAVCFSNDGQCIFGSLGYTHLGPVDYSIGIWNRKSGEMEGKFTGHKLIPFFLQPHPRGDSLVSGGCKDDALVWNIETRSIIRSFPGGNGIGLSSDGKDLAIAGKNGDIQIFDLASGDKKTECGAEILCRASEMARLRFSDSGRYLAVGYSTGSVEIWDLTDSSLVQTLLFNELQDLCFTRNGHYLIVASQFRVYEVALKDLSWRRSSAQSGKIYSVINDPCRNLIVMGSKDGAIRFWNPDSGEIMNSFDYGAEHDRAHAHDLHCQLSLSNDGSFVMTAPLDGKVRLWKDVFKNSLEWRPQNIFPEDLHAF